MKEVENMKKFKHPYIVELIDHYPCGRTRYNIIQEYCEKGNLEKELEQYLNKDFRLAED